MHFPPFLLEDVCVEAEEADPVTVLQVLPRREESRMGSNASIVILLLYCLSFDSGSSSSDTTCFDEASAATIKRAQDLFDALSATPTVSEARIDDVEEEDDDNLHQVKVSYITSKYNPEKKVLESARRGLTADRDNVVTEDRLLDRLDGVLFVDYVGQDRWAQMYVSREDGEQYLTVNTSNAATSCTWRLSSHTDHGQVLTDMTLGVFRFSPSGRHILYQAEVERTDSDYLHQDSFVEKDFIVATYLYDVDEEKFVRLTAIPEDYTPGHLHWDPRGGAIVGVAWETHLFRSSGDPDDANKMNRLFSISVRDDGQHTFKFLTETNKHYAWPRISPDGASLVFLENDLHSSTEPPYHPGPNQISRRLARVSWSPTKFSGRFITDDVEYVISNSQNGVQHPVVLPDGDTFFGIYLYTEAPLPPPERIFSDDGQTVYLTVIQLAQVRLMAIDLSTKQITIHPEPGLVLLDVFKDVMLVKSSSVSDTPHVKIGRLHQDYFTTTSTTTTTTTTTTTATATTTTTTRTTTKTTTTVADNDTTTVDPCQHLIALRNGQERNNDAVVDVESSAITSTRTTTDAATSTTTTAENEEESATSATATTTTVHPLSIPLPLAHVEFSDLTNSSHKEFDVTLIRDNLTSSNGWLALPAHRLEKIPLLVFLKKATPHSAKLTTYCHLVDFFLQMHFGVLAVNPRGSSGAGDGPLQKLSDGVGELEVFDVNETIDYVLEVQKEVLDRDRVVLFGDGAFGGFIAMHLAATNISNLIVVDPLVDLLATRYDGYGGRATFLPSLFGQNFSPEQPDNLIMEAWKRSPLQNVSSFSSTPTLIFSSGGELEFQSEVLFRALRSRNFEAEKVSYHHQLDRGDNGRRLQASHAIAWLHRLWEADNVHCRPSTTTSTEKSYNSSLTTSSTTTQTEQPNPSDPSPPSNSGFYFSAGKNFLSLPIFVLVLPIITMLAD